jgi:hypothetical protein
MAVVDYYGIKTQLKAIIDADATLGSGNSNVFVEPKMVNSPELCPWVGIYGINRTASDAEQSLAAGLRTSYQYSVLLIVVHYNPEDIALASKARDDFMGSLEVLLMQNRTIGGKVESSWINGGTLSSAEIGTDRNIGFISAAELELVCRVTAAV